MSKKIIIILLASVIVLFAGAMVLYFSIFGDRTGPLVVNPDPVISPVTQEQEPDEPIIDKTGSIFFSTDQVEVTVGQNFQVGLLADAGGQDAAGLDIVLNFDKTLLELGEVMPSTDFNLVIPELAGQTAGAFSLLMPPSQFFNDQQQVAELTFTPKQSGETEISFMATVGSSSDTNIAGPGGDILRKTRSVRVIIK